MTFIVHLKNGDRETYNTRCNVEDEQGYDLAWEEVNMEFPDAEYIDEL